MKEKQFNSITINQESYLSSLAKDLTSLGILGFFCWFNHNFIGGSYFVNFLILCMISLYAAKIKKSGLKDAGWYFGVSSEKIKKIKEILDNE
jgi:hypothetical protein